MSGYFVVALFTYFTLAIANVAVGGRFIVRLKRDHPATWERLGKPTSVFSSRRETVDLYRFIATSTDSSFNGDTGMFRLTKTLMVVTIATQLMFLVAVAAFVAG